MPQRPLLIFPPPSSVSRSSLHGGGAAATLPGHSRQVSRLGPRFETLRQSFDSTSPSAQLSPDGADPDRVVVLETVGTVEEFSRAVQRIPGMSFLGEHDVEDLPADEDFADPSEPAAPLSGRLYLVLSNQQAIHQLLSLWARYQADPDADLGRGLGRFKQVFARLRDIRRWDTHDRLDHTGVFEHWREMLEHEVDPIRFEAELWFLANPARRARALQNFTQAVQEVGGQCGSPVTIAPIAYHAVLVRLPRGAVQSVLDQQELRLLHAEAVMHFRPVGQCLAPLPEEGGLQSSVTTTADLPGDAPPTVALLDGLPLENHARLAGRLVVDDPDNWAEGYAPTDRQHGTSMASLIVHGDLSNPGPALVRPLYVRPVMRPDPYDWRVPRSERIPDDVLPCDLIFRAVKRMKEGEGAEPASAPSVRVVNLSLGDPDQLFDRRMSAWGKLLDWLSWHYNLLFIVSTGNNGDALRLDVAPRGLASLSEAEVHRAVRRALYHRSHLLRLMSPSEGLNVLTVGAKHEDNSGVAANPPYRYDPVPFSHPAVYSRVGLSYRGAIKPDLLNGGGRCFLRERPFGAGGGTEVEQIQGVSPPGHQVASPGLAPGEVNRTQFSRGTSNAAALTTRPASFLIERIAELRGEPGGEVLQDEFMACLVKCLLIHGCGWNGCCEPWRELFRRQVGSKYSGVARAVHEKNAVARFLGYGATDPARVQYSDDHRVTLLGCGRLRNDEAHEFVLPVPERLNGIVGMRRLIVTLAWFTPINPLHAKYRKAALWFEVGGVDALRLARRDAEWHTVRRGTVQHEIFQGERAVVVADGARSIIKVNCKEEAGSLRESVRYGLAVTLEVAPDLGVNVYEEVRAKLRPQVGIQP